MIIDNLRSVGIATVVSAENDSATGAMSFPACVSTAVSVGSTTKSDGLSSFSNISALTSLLAPGEPITSSVPGIGYAAASGTSMAAAHVAGAWAIFRQPAPSATVDEILMALQSTGLPISDTRGGGSVFKPRIRISQALSALGVGSMGGVSPSGGFAVPAAAATLALSFNGKVRDRVGRGEAGLNPDGAVDGTFTVTLQAGSGPRTVTGLALDRGPQGRWDTVPGNGFWVLGAASGFDTPLLNGSSGTIGMPVADGASFVFFAADFSSTLFAPGVVFTLVASFADGSSASATTTVASEFTISLVANGISNPTAMAFAPDGRLFVAEQGGRLRVIKNGALLQTEFVSVTTDASGERGLLGVAFDPNFATNQFVYVYYTATTPTIHNRVSRFTASGDVAVPGSEAIILDLNSLSSATNHNGGAIHFGLDAKLYIGVGENANGANAQTLTNLLGKMLRINPDGSIPSDNPFVGSASGANRAIWALGLRNPFTFAVQPGTGRLFINDVGENTWEEINDGIAGSNYGWPTTEGPTTDPRFRNPLFAYGHGTGPTTGCAITGGAFYNPTTVQFPSDFVGDYFFADLCSGWIRRFDPVSGIVTDLDRHAAALVAARPALEATG